MKELKKTYPEFFIYFIHLVGRILSRIVSSIGLCLEGVLQISG